MKLPIILQADDGVTWWPEPGMLEISVESPDIEDVNYAAWDAEGQVLEITAAQPVSRRSFIGISTVSVSSGALTETGKYEPDQLRSVIIAHLENRTTSTNIEGEDLASLLACFCRDQPAC